MLILKYSKIKESTKLENNFSVIDTYKVIIIKTLSKKVLRTGTSQNHSLYTLGKIGVF